MPQPYEPACAQSTAQTQSGGRRFVISHLRAVHGSRQSRQRSLESFDKSFNAQLRGSVDVLGEHAPMDDEGRRVILCEGDPQEMLTRWPQMPADSIIEPEVLKTPLVAPPAIIRLMAAQSPTPTSSQAGSGASFTARLTLRGAPLGGASVLLLLLRIPPPFFYPWGYLPWMAAGAAQSSVLVTGTTNANGEVKLDYDPLSWRPSGMVLAPRDSAWGVEFMNPLSGMSYELPPLPQEGPLGWWHHLVGVSRFSATRGSGIRIGVIDTGIGPHPYLSHVKGIGAFIDGAYQDAPEMTADVEQHGTHVCGIIGALPPDGSRDYGGIAPGADVFVARVFKAATGSTPTNSNQGDLANAIDTLSSKHQVDLINLSLGGAPSLLEQDAIAFAQQNGTLCICAAGNESGAAIAYPAAYPQCVAVSALGLLGAAPAGTTAALNLPSTPDKYTWNGLFLASFSSVGPQMACTAPGNGIISTVPASQDAPKPYAALSGTSMAAPVATATLAVLLSEDARYKELPRDEFRAAYARTALLRNLISIGLNPMYQGWGVVRDQSLHAGQSPRG
ncbi:S8 family peptidase [Archangium lansingense]|uniref:S8 family serine peptidase n=1 Tax=Archangium lansingense TaxID=2995310 RepID=A0ABT4ACP1_9BACT|nr:S8 family serine peptidase [Archangium lansinium]MCY1079427.1 S8 family serine peptidase [Archangium lansinium]